jgi:hypothetical protein
LDKTPTWQRKHFLKEVSPMDESKVVRKHAELKVIEKVKKGNYIPACYNVYRTGGGQGEDDDIFAE